MLVLRRINVLGSKVRHLSSTSLIQVTIDEKTNVAKAALQRPPVNSLNTELLSDIKNVVEQAEKTKCKGLILTSNVPGIFTAGLDLMEFYKTDVPKLKTFWTTLQDTFLKLYTTPMPTVALINGHSPAGGCMLAMTCDYRVMLGPKFTIGLNEAKIGIPAPFWFMDVMSSIIGARKTEQSVLSGRMYSTEEALTIGLVDEFAKDASAAELKVNTYLQNINKAPADCRALMKQEFRKDIVNKFARGRDEELQFLLQIMMQPKMQKKFELYLEALKKKS